METDIQPGGLLRTLIVPQIESFQRIVGSQIKKQKERLQPPFSLFKDLGKIKPFTIRVLTL